MSESIILYGHATCPGVPPVKAMLSQAKVPYRYVDIHQDPQAAATVRSINNGNESVPTLVFPDGSTLTEPSGNQLKRKLEESGYKVGVLAWILGNSFQIIMGLIILYAILRFLNLI